MLPRNSAWIGSIQVRSRSRLLYLRLFICLWRLIDYYSRRPFQYALTFFPSLFTGRLFDLGYFKLLLFTASCTLIIATFLTAQCTQYWHFVLCQGIVVGVSPFRPDLFDFEQALIDVDRPQVSSGTIFGPTIGVISHWFKKRRGFACM